MDRIKKFFRYWTQDKGLLFFLISLTFLMFVLYPLVGNGKLGEIATNIFILIALFSGVVTIDPKKRYRIIFIFFLAFIVIANIFEEIFDNEFVIQVHIFSRIFLLWVLIVLIFLRVFGKTPITFFYKIAGLITIYLLIGFIWANMYFLFYHLDPSSFNFSFPVRSEENTMFNFIYFSFVTLTTLGLGDILPMHPMIRSFVILEAILGPLYLAILIGRLISKQTDIKKSDL